MRKSHFVESLPDTRASGQSHVIETDNLVFAASMALSHDLPRRRDPRAVTVADETRICFERLKEKLAAAGCTLNDVAKMTCYLSNREHQKEFVDVYKTYWAEGTYPVRCTFFVGLALDCRVEIDAVAVKPTSANGR